MKYWILTIFRLKEQMPKLCGRIDNQIERLAVNLTMDTHKLIKAILVLQDRKTRFINMHVLYNRMRAVLSPAEYALVMRYAQGKTLLEIALADGVAECTVSRRLRGAVEVCAAVANNLRFGCERFERDYRDVPLVYNTVKGFERCGGHKIETPAFFKAGAGASRFDGITV